MIQQSKFHSDHHILFYGTLHKQLCNLKTTLAIDPHTGRVLTESVLQAKTKKRPNKWVMPPSQRGKVKRIIGWEKKVLILVKQNRHLSKP